MALIVEDGTGKIDAESFASVAEADTRLAALGMTIWTDLSPTEKEQALRRATNYIEHQFYSYWLGYRYTAAQALGWPRGDVVVNDFTVLHTVLPVAVRNATIDLALKAAAGDLNPDVGGEYPVKKKKIGPIEKEYDTSGSQTKSYRAITMLLKPYLKSSGTRVVR